MKEINMKSTKQEIMDAYQEAKSKLDSLTDMKDDPVTEAKAKADAEVIKSANTIVEKGILAPEIVEEYQNLCKAIDMKKSEIKELYGIESEANTMVAMINAHKDLKTQLTENHIARREAADQEFEEKKAELEAKIALLETQRTDLIKATKEENDALINELKKNRKREEEEYAYSLKRQRQIENDKWDDEKAVREKMLEEKEAAVRVASEEVMKEIDYGAEVGKKVAEIPALVEAAKTEGEKKGKADADKSNVFEVRAINTKNEYEQKMLNDQVSRLAEALAAAELKNSVLQEKLDDAYTQMRELAAETVKSTGGVKILNHENSSK